MSREKIIGVLYIMTFLLAAYIKFTNPHLFSVNSSKGIHEAASIAYLGQFYEDKLLWSRPVNSTKFSVTMWREVLVRQGNTLAPLDQNLFKSQADSSTKVHMKKTFVVRQEENSVGVNEPQSLAPVHLYPHANEASTSAGNELELGLADAKSAGSYKLTWTVGAAANPVEEEKLIGLDADEVGKIFFRKRFDPEQSFRLRLWRKVDIDVPDLDYKILGKVQKESGAHQEKLYSLTYDELLIDLDKHSAESAKREVVNADRSIMMKLIAENTRLSGTYSLDVREESGRINFKSHVFDIASKHEFAIVYPDFDSKPEQLAGVPYQDFVVGSEPIDGFMLIVADQVRKDTLSYSIENRSEGPKITSLKSTGLDRLRGFQLKVNQDHKIVSFDLPLQSSKQITAVARAGRDEKSKQWNVPIRRLAFSVWPPIQPRYWHNKEKQLYQQFCKQYPTQASGGSGTPLLYEGRAVSIYYDVENVDRDNYAGVSLEFSDGRSVSLKPTAYPIEYTLPVDISSVRLGVNLKETSMSSTFAVKSVPDEFGSKIELSPPLEMVSEYNMSTFQVVDFFGEFVSSELVSVDVSGVPRSLVRMNKSDKDRIKVELIGIKAQSNIRAKVTLLRSPFSRQERAIDIGRVALKN